MKNLILVISCFILSLTYTNAQTSFKDPRDGKVYKTTKIGSQVWMAENLTTSKFNNGDLIPQAKSLAEFIEAGRNNQPIWCYYEFSETYGKYYGKLYNWYAITDPRGLAPTNWHVPSQNEWRDIERCSAKKYKSKVGWQSYSAGTNETGFSALPGGRLSVSEPDNLVNGYSFNDIGYYTHFWSSTEDGANHAWYRSLTETNGFESNSMLKMAGFSVRCVKN